MMFGRSAILGLVASVLFVSASFAADEMKPAFGNTVEVKDSKGAVMSYWFNEDGSYSLKSGATTTKGKWAVKNGQVCLVPDGGQENCQPSTIAGKKPGDSWENTNAADNTKVTVTIKAGRS